MAEKLDRLITENAMLREVYSETQVTFEDSRIDFVDVRVPRSLWLRLRAWRASDKTNGRAGSRWERFTYDELQIISAALPRDALSATDVSISLQRQLERAKHDRSFEEAS